MGFSNSHIYYPNCQQADNENFPVIFGVILMYLATLADPSQIVTALIALIFFVYALWLGIAKIDLIISFFISISFFLFTQRFSLTLVFPLLAITLSVKYKSIKRLDYIAAVLFLISTLFLKIYFELDDYVYFDRNHLGLMALLLILINPKNVDKFILLIKAMLLLSAVFLLSRTYILFGVIFIVLYAFRFGSILVKNMSPGFLISFLLMATMLSVFLTIGIDLDLFESNVGNDTTRIVEINDASNKARIGALLSYMDHLSSQLESILLPTTIEDYQEKYGDIPTPHNTLLAINFNYGLVLSICYLFYVGKILKKINASRFFFLVFAPYYLLLGGVILGPALILFCIAGRRNQ